MISQVVLYAPNVHTGGGYVLLDGLLRAWPSESSLTAFLDERARERLTLNANVSAHWVCPSVRSRWIGECELQSMSNANTTVLCFHGLPPLRRNAGRVVLFQQNRNYLGLNALSQFALKTALRLGFERTVSKLFRHRVDQYIVQTPSMARDLAHWYGPPLNGRSQVRIQVLPFVDAWSAVSNVESTQQVGRPWDFVYVSDGEAHKNHATLFEAWRLLAQQGLKPSLALTLGPRDHGLIKAAEALRKETGAAVENLGHLSREHILGLYKNAGALIFPSTSESFGLPLIEAHHLGVPVLAPELDYVRDVCEPAQTFDPLSPTSIARAVRRFIHQPEPRQPIGQPADLWAALHEADAPQQEV